MGQEMAAYRHKSTVFLAHSPLIPSVERATLNLALAAALRCGKVRGINKTTTQTGRAARPQGITTESRFIERALSNLGEFMADDGQQFIYQTFIAPAAGTDRFSKALDRQVLGP